MIFRIAGVLLTTTGLLAAAGVTDASASSNTPCLVAVNSPCVWQRTTADGKIGAARIYPGDDRQLTLLQVEVKVERSWGRPWETVASTTQVQNGSIAVATPTVTTDLLTIVCATGGPADRPDLQTTRCTTPY